MNILTVFIYIFLINTNHGKKIINYINFIFCVKVQNFNFIIFILLFKLIKYFESILFILTSHPKNRRE